MNAGRLALLLITLNEADAFVQQLHRHYRPIVGHKRGGGSWSRADRPMIDKHPTQGKLLWELSTMTNRFERQP